VVDGQATNEWSGARAASCARVCVGNTSAANAWTRADASSGRVRTDRTMSREWHPCAVPLALRRVIIAFAFRTAANRNARPCVRRLEQMQFSITCPCGGSPPRLRRAAPSRATIVGAVHAGDSGSTPSRACRGARNTVAHGAVLVDSAGGSVRLGRAMVLRAWSSPTRSRTFPTPGPTGARVLESTAGTCARSSPTSRRGSWRQVVDEPTASAS